MPSAQLLAAGIDVAHRVARGEPAAALLTDRTWRLLNTDAGAGLVTYNRRLGQIVEVEVAVAGAAPVPADIAYRARTLAPQHPGIAQLITAGTVTPVRVSDVVKLRSFWGTEVYEYMHGFNGGRYPMAAGLLMSADQVVYLALHRSDRDFTDEDVADLQCLQQVVAPAYAYRAALDAAIRQFDMTTAGLPGERLSQEQRATRPVIAATLCQEFQPTRREAEVLCLVTAGWTDRQIARRLGITERTVRKHLTEVFDKAGVRGRAAVAAWWQHTLDTQPTPKR